MAKDAGGGSLRRYCLLGGPWIDTIWRSRSVRMVSKTSLSNQTKGVKRATCESKSLDPG